MIKNKASARFEPRVKFVSYSGKWPNLCSGTLVLEIDGEIWTFGDALSDASHERFWIPGGDCGDVSLQGEWATDIAALPEELRELNLALEIDRVINASIERGHCRGCR